MIIQNSIQTNGYGIDDKWCKFFYDNNFLVGLSVDGTKKCHDKYRHNKNGEDTYDRIIATSKLLDQYKVDYNILTVVTQDVAKNISKIYENYKRRGWKYLQFIPCLDPLEERRGDNIYSLNPEEYGDFLVELYKLWFEDYKRQQQPFIRQFENYIGIMLGYEPEACDQRGVCGLQHVVEADGSVYPCDFYVLDEYKIGDFNINTFDEIQEKRSEIGFIERSYKIDDTCRQCEYYKLCRGGCQRNRIGEETYTNYYCESYKRLFEVFKLL